MSDIRSRIEDIVGRSDVTLSMKGTAPFPAMRFFLARRFDPRTSRRRLRNRRRPPGSGDPRRHQGLFRLADGAAALRQGRVPRRLRHHDGDVRGRRAADFGRREAGREGGVGESGAGLRHPLRIIGTRRARRLGNAMGVTRRFRLTSTRSGESHRCLRLDRRYYIFDAFVPDREESHDCVQYGPFQGAPGGTANSSTRTRLSSATGLASGAKYHQDRRGSYCIIAEWDDMESLAATRPNMIATPGTLSPCYTLRISWGSWGHRSEFWSGRSGI